MILRLTSALDVVKARHRLEALIAKGATIELTEKAQRTPTQNRYCHLLIGMAAMFTGNTLADTKEWYFKRLVNPDIFITRRTDQLGNEIESVRSSASLSKDEMCKAIDRFKRWGYENRIPMPEAGDEQLLKDIEYEMSKQQYWL